MSQMTTADKVGQIMMGFFNGASLDEEQVQRIKDLRLGGLILYPRLFMTHRRERVEIGPSYTTRGAGATELIR